jgi:hypothetical protein
MQQNHSNSSPTIASPIVIFDTSAHNRFERGGEDADRVIARVRSARFVRIGGMSVEELFGTSDTHRRGSLFTCSEKLIAGTETDTLLPPNELLRRLVLEHQKCPWIFNWMLVNVQNGDYHHEIAARTLLNDEALSLEQRNQMKELDRQHRKMFSSLRSKVEALFAARGDQQPLTFEDALVHIENEPQSVRLGYAQMFYEKITGWKISRFGVSEFMEICPPFKALVYATLLPMYDLAIRDKHRGERFQAGRADLMMAVYLPYCDEFVTDECHGEQARCLKKIAQVAGFATEVLSYDDFIKRLPV